MLAIHPNARTTLAVRVEIARSAEGSGVLAKRYGVSAETIRKWRKRGPDACHDRSARPHKLPWRASDEERAVVCALRRSTGFALDDLTFVVGHFLPHLNRDAVYRILKAAGLNRLPPSERVRRAHGTFDEHEVGVVHVAVKPLPDPQDRDRVTRKRYVYIAVDRVSRDVHLAVEDDDTAASAVAFLEDALGAFPFRVTHVLTDCGSCFAADVFGAACAQRGVQHRMTRSYPPHTNGGVERVDGRLQRARLRTTLHSHRDSVTALRGFNAAYEGRGQRALDGLSPEEGLRQRPEAKPGMADPGHTRSDPGVPRSARRAATDTKKVSQPDVTVEQRGLPAADAAYRALPWPAPFDATTHRIRRGDARDLSWIPDESVHLVVTSPPYWTLKEYAANRSQMGAIVDYEDFLGELDKVWSECRRVLAPGGRICCVVGDVCIPRKRGGRHYVMPLHADIQARSRKLGLDCLTPILWHKIANGVTESIGNGAGFYGKPYQPGAIVKNDVEYVLFMRKGGSYRKPSELQKTLSMLTKAEMQAWWRSIWLDIKGASTRCGHPAPFPTALAGRLIRMFSFAGDTVLDPFAGTGSTNVAAVAAGRNSIGNEIEPSYVKLAKARLKEAAAQRRLHGAVRASFR